MSRAVLSTLGLALAATTLAAPAWAADMHTAPKVGKVVRAANGRVRSCQLTCTLVGTEHPTARVTLHREHDYDDDLPRMDDPTRRFVAAGVVRTPVSGRGARWVSTDVTKAGHVTPVVLDLDFGADGLEGSEEPAARWVLTSAHFRTAPTVLGPAPHVFAAETAPVQRPEPSFYFRFKE